MKIILKITMLFIILIFVVSPKDYKLVKAINIEEEAIKVNKNPNSIKFLEDKNETIIIKTINESVVIVEGKTSNKRELVNRIKEENGMSLDLLILRNTDLESENFIKRMINCFNIKKIVIPSINNISKNLTVELKRRNISLGDMRDGVNYNVGNVDIKCKSIGKMNNEGIIFFSADNIKVGLISKDMYKEIKKQNFLIENNVDILNIRGNSDFSEDEFKGVVKELSPMKVIGLNQNQVYYEKESKKRGVRYYSLNGRGHITIKRILGEKNNFQII